MSEHCLSVFIDESGDFGAYAPHSPYYFVAMVLHDQRIDISNNISAFEEHLTNLGYPHHAVHTGPLIRRESVYSNDLVEDRKKLFNALFHFARKLPMQYTFAMVKKSECPDEVTLIEKLTKAIAARLRENESFWNSFDRIIVYYDNGQTELTKILVSVFSTLFTHVEYRKVKPADYKLFQVADLVCTLELLDEKMALSHSELDFFGNKRDLKKNYLKALRNKQL